MRHQVLLAQPYDSYRLGSLGDAAYMYLRQENFPLDYDEASGDKMMSADHDRLAMWDYDHFRRICDEHLNTGECGIGQWIREASVPRCFEFLKAALKADNRIKWTGFRVTGTVNRSNGYPVYSLELFRKGEKSETKVYSGECAPNVRWVKDCGEVVGPYGEVIKHYGEAEEESMRDNYGQR